MQGVRSSILLSSTKLFINEKLSECRINVIRPPPNSKGSANCPFLALRKVYGALRKSPKIAEKVIAEGDFLVGKILRLVLELNNAYWSSYFRGRTYL